MAVPVIPFLLLGLLLAGKKKKKKKPEEEKPLVITSVTKARPKIQVMPAAKRGEGKPGAYCRPPKGSSQGTYAAYNNAGVCNVFWTPETDGRMILALKEAYDRSLNKAAVCDILGDNPLRKKLIKEVILSQFRDISADELPARTGSLYRTSIVWNLTVSHFDRHLCSYVPVS